MSHCPFHLSLHHSRCDTSLFASKWLYVSCYACWLAPCDLGDPGWGIPGFRMVLLLLRSPPGMALCLCFSSLLFLLPYLVKMIQCYHSCAHELAPVTPVFGCFVLGCCVLLWLCGFFASVFVFFWVFDDFVTDWTMYRSFTFLFVWLWLHDGLLAWYSSLLTASQSADGHVYALINPCSPICNMQLNVLNDLAEAMKALEGKNVYRSFTRSLLKPLNLQAALYALISQLTLFCNMQLNVLDDLAEAMKALDGKKDEVDTATKLLDKACQKLRGIPDVRITDLETAISQMRQLSCILDSCTISASYEVSQARAKSHTAYATHSQRCKHVIWRAKCTDFTTHRWRT